MPFFIRARQLDIPTPTISTVASDDEDNFITDPEKFFDELPQPYRFIDKVLNGLIETAWERISEREKLREIEAKRIKPPTYSASGRLEQYDNISCLCPAQENIMFLSLENLIVSVKNDSYEEIASWRPEQEVCFEKISNAFLKSLDMYLLTVIDDMGFCNLLVYENDKFHFVCFLNELVDGAPKSNVVHAEFSKDGQYCGVSLETNNVSTIDFYRIPLENWTKEIDSAHKEYQKKAESVGAGTANDDESNNSSHPSQADVEFPPIKFSNVVPILKVNEPSKIDGIAGKTPQQLIDSVSSDVIGDGTCHLYSDSALNVQSKLFHILNERDLVYAEDEECVVTYQPQFHFLQKSLMEPPIQTKGDSSYIYVGVWWTHHHNFYVYQLNKAGKNIEFKPDGVWPQCADITSCTVACNTTLLAIGLSNGTLTLWDRSLSLVKNVMMISPSVPVTSIQFLIAENPTQTQYSFRGKDVALLVGSENGQICHVISGQRPSSRVVVSESSQCFEVMKPVVNLPKVFLMILKDGSLALHTTTESDSLLCYLSLPEDFHCEGLYQSGCVLDANGEILYVKSSSISTSGNSIFLFHLRNFPTLDKFRESCKVVESFQNVSFDDTVHNLLTERMRQQACRTEKLSARWHHLDKQLQVIGSLKESVSIMKREEKFSRKSTSAARWGRTTSRIISHNNELKRIQT